MTKYEKDILENAGQLVDKVVDQLDKLDFTPEEKLQALAEHQQILLKANEIIDVMIYGKGESFH